MANQSLILEWLDENRNRAYPLQSKFGKVKLFPNNGSAFIAAGSFSISTNSDINDYCKVGDQIFITNAANQYIGFDIDINNTLNRPNNISVSTTATDTLVGKYYINKRNGILDSLDSPVKNVSLNNILLDANLVFTDPITSPISLNKFEITNHDMVVTISGTYGSNTVTQTFTIPSYTRVSYPYYARNNKGSLLVFSENLAQITNGVTIECENVYFEDTVCSFFTGKWAGVSSLSFNSESESTKTGNIIFTDGYQFKLLPDNGRIKLAAGSSYGMPIGCTKFFPQLINDCESVVSSICSVGPMTDSGDFKITGGNGVAVYADTPTLNPLTGKYTGYRIYVGLKFATDDICKPIVSTPTPNII